MNSCVLLKHFAKKFFGRFLKRYRRFLPQLNELQKQMPVFLRQCFFETKPQKKLLVITSGLYDGSVDAVYAKSLEGLGYETHILTFCSPFLKELFAIFGFSKIHFFESYFKKYSPKKLKIEAERILVENEKEQQKILDFQQDNVHIGAFAASTFLRVLRQSSFFIDQTNRSQFLEHLTNSLLAKEAALDIVNSLNPDLVFMVDRGYTPTGQIFDVCLAKGINVITRNSSHKSGSEILKRYKNPQMAGIHPHSLSKETWQDIKSQPFSEDKWQGLYNELSQTYQSGDWFSEVGTQFNKRVYSRQDLIKRLGLDVSKKTACIFPHIFWDGTFFFGSNLFADYYEWFCCVIKTAAQNKNLNWLIKIHPANFTKDKRDNYKGENLEVKAIRETLGDLPEHIRIIKAESDINTFSLYSLIDYCITVRGTPGLEASALGVAVLTSGTGRYDRLGFTYDFDSKKEFLDYLQNLHKAPSMSPEMINLARRFAYAIFVLRPIHFDIFEHKYLQDEKASFYFKPLFKTKEEFENSGFVKGFQGFILSNKEDYLNIEA